MKKWNGEILAPIEGEDRLDVQGALVDLWNITLERLEEDSGKL